VAITTDNGSEFARWRQIEAALKHAQEALNHRPRARLNGNTPSKRSMMLPASQFKVESAIALFQVRAGAMRGSMLCRACGTNAAFNTLCDACAVFSLG
jgi:hypothetical protein